MADRQLICTAFIRVCKDSRWAMEATKAAQIAAGVVKVHPIEVLGAVGLDNMLRIARGEHPACERAC